MGLKEFILPLLVPICTAILSGLGLWLQDWRQERNVRFQRKQARDEADELIAVLQKWVQAEEAIAAPAELDRIKQKALLQLDQAFNKLQETHERRAQPLGRPFIQRALLWYKPGSIAGWVAHVLFYLLILTYLFFILSGLSDPLDAGIISASDPVPSQALSILFYIVVLTVVVFLPAMVVQGWASHLDRKQFELATSAAQRPPPPPISEVTPSIAKPQ